MAAAPSVLAGRLRLAAVALALFGWVAGIGLYLTADDNDEGDVVGYQVIGGQTFPVRLADATRQLQQLERIGGKAAVLSFEFDLWLRSLAHGRRGAWTLALLASAGAALCWRIAAAIRRRATPRA